jgi:hypothetical protein
MNKYTKNVQTLLSEDTLNDLNRLIMMEALENGTPPKGKSEWIRILIEETIEYNKTKIDSWNKDMIKQIKSK